MAEESTFQSVFGQTPGQLGLGAAGSIAGGALNYFFNSQLQHNQFKEQEKLQKRAMELNEQAVARQAPNQVLGMQNAGLNPAGVNGQGAPSVQAGAAAGSTSQLATIFQGVAEIVAASKAPEEVKNIQADVGLKNAETENVKTDTTLIKPVQAEELAQLANKHVAEANHHVASADNTQQLTQMVQDRDDFLRKYSGSLYSGYMDNLKQTGQWEKLSPRTKETIEKLASGDIDVGIGALEGIKDLVASQQGLMDADKNIVKDLVDIVVTRQQLNDKEVMGALEKLPENQRKLMMSEISNYYAQALKATTDAARTNTLKWLDEHTSDEWLIEHGMSDEIERRKYKEVFNNLLKLTDPQTYTNVIGGGLIGKGISSTKNVKRDATYPSDKGIFYKGGLRGYQESGPIKNNSPWNNTNDLAR